MKLHSLLKVKTKSKKRIGRGLGSGKGKTGGRGTKGQKARGKLPPLFAGSNLPFYRKLPLRRGKGNRQVSDKPKVISLSALKDFKAKSVVDLEQLLNLKIISKKDAQRGVKIMGEGELNQALVVKVPVSASARQKIESKGGRVEYA